METETHLIFGLNDLQYGINTAQVREIFQLPELTPIADAPGDIIGILNYRGAILPVMHLAKRLGQATPTCQLSDSVVVVEYQGFKVGMVVTQVYDVQAIHPSSIEPEPAYQDRNPIHTAFVAGVAKVKGQLITLLNPETLIRQTNEVALMAWELKLNHLETNPSYSPGSPPLNRVDNGGDAYPDERIFETQPTSTLTNFFDLYCPNVTPRARQIFHQRAVGLRQSQENADSNELIPLAIVGLGKEYFGLVLDRIREFITIRNVMPMPCCPHHIVGNMNLRGEVITLVDIRRALNLSQSEADVTQTTFTQERVAKAIVIEVDDVVAGITVDQVLDVIYLPSSGVASMPAALPKTRQDFFQGVTRYHQKTLSILNLPKILSLGGLIVDQAA
ncbi:MAG: chemotaxis protein CheW [Cyanobacteria bacterium J06635_1]